MSHPKSFTGLFNPESPRLLLALRAQGFLPWAFFASCLCHVVLVIATPALSARTPHEIRRSKNSKAIQVTVRTTPVGTSVASDSLGKDVPLLPSLARSQPSQSLFSSAVEAQEVDASSADATKPHPETIQPIPLPTGITSIWGPARTHRPETIQQSAAKAQWQARTQEAFRQLSMLQQTFAHAPRPDQAIRCTVSATVQTCTPSDTHLAQFWAIQLGALFRIDPSFPTVEMHYALEGGWYAAVQKPLPSALSIEP